MISRANMANIMDDVFEGCRMFRDAGQKEYAHAEDNALANFERVAERQGLSREQVLMVYAEKHLDGIHSYIQGHKSQREDVRGRIKDVIVYMCLLYAMVEDRDAVASPISDSLIGYKPGLDSYALVVPDMLDRLRAAFPKGNWLCECGVVNGPAREACGFCDKGKYTK